MSDIGNKMFGENVRNAAVGGAFLGGFVGLAKAQSDINKALQNVSEQTVEVPSYQKPIFEDEYIGSADFRPDRVFGGYSVKGADNNYDIYSTFPATNENGSIKYETVPAQTVTGKGEPSISYETQEIAKPLATPLEERTLAYPHQSWNDDDRYLYVLKQKVGEYDVPSANFDTGIDKTAIRLKNVGVFATLGAAFGAIGAAIYETVVNGS